MAASRRSACVVFAFFLTVTFSSAVRSGEDAREPAASFWDVTPLLPADTLAVVTVTDAGKALKKFSGTGLYQIYAHPDIQKVLRARTTELQVYLAMLEMQFGIKVSDLTSLFLQGESTFAVLKADRRNDQGQPQPEVLVSVQARDKAAELLDEINRRLDQLPALGGMNVPVSQSMIDNVAIKKLALPNLSIFIAQADGNVLISNQEGCIEKLLGARAKAAQGLPPGAPVELLSQVAAFQKTRAKAGSDADLIAFVSIERILANALFNIQPRNPEDERNWKILGLASLRSLAYALEFKGQSLHETVYLDSPAETRTGLLKLVDTEGLSTDAFGIAPRNSVLAVALKVSPDRILDKLLELTGTIDPAACAQLQQGILMAGQALNLDLRRDLLSTLSGELVFCAGLPRHGGKLDLGMPQVLLTIGVQDPDRLRTTLSDLWRQAKDNLEVSTLDDGRRQIVTLRQTTPGKADPGRCCYAIDGRQLLVALYPLALREEFKRRDALAAATDPEKRIALPNGALPDDPNFTAATRAFSSRPQLLFYADTAAVAGALYDTFVPVLQFNARQYPFLQRLRLDVSALPPSDELVKNLGGSMAGLQVDGDGLLIEVVSPTGLIPAIAAAIPVGARRRARAQARQGAAELEKNQQMLAILRRELKAYADENGGALPGPLSALPPKYLAELGADQIAQIVFLGQQAAPNRIVAHTSEKLPGPITALLQDGRIVLIPRVQFGKTLNEGYTPASGTEEAGKAAPDPNANDF